MNLSLIKHWQFFVIIAFIWAGFSLPLLKNDPLLERDDMALVSAVGESQGPVDYANRLVQGKLLDLQPIRDFSFWINLKLKDNFGYGGFHLFNLLLGLFILGMLHKIFPYYGISLSDTFLCLLILACHPVFNSAIAWTSNRKHLLAVAFILSFHLSWLKHKQVTPWGLCLALLSILSQPITAFIILLAALYEMTTQGLKKVSFSGWILILMTLLILILNFIFYRTMPEFQERNTMGEMEGNFFGLGVLRLGRVFVQIFFPLNIAMEYDEGNPLGLIGLGILVVTAWLILKKKNFTKLEIFTLLMGLSTLFPVLSWSARDAYLITSLFVLCPMAIFFFKNQFPRFFNYIFPVSLLLLSYQSWRFTRMWTDDITLAQVSYEVEGGMINQWLYAKKISKVNPTKSYFLINDLMQSHPDVYHYQVYPLFAETYYLSEHITPAEKVKEYLGTKVEEPHFLFFKGNLLLKQGLISEAQQSFEGLNKNIQRYPVLLRKFQKLICPRYESECANAGIRL